MRETLRREYERQSSVAGEQDRASALQLEAIRTRLSRLLDAYLDGTLDKPAFEAKRRTLLIDEQLIEEARLARATDQARSTGEETLGVIPTLLLGYEIGQPEDRKSTRLNSRH